MDYGYLGVTTLSLWPQLARRLGADGSGGALVQEVEDDSPAADAGVEAGDDKITFQGQPDIPNGRRRDRRRGRQAPHPHA